MIISVKVKTNSRIEEIVQDNELYLVKVKDPPKEGKANQAVIRLLAKYFQVPPSSVIIIKGLTGRNKIIEII